MTVTGTKGSVAADSHSGLTGVAVCRVNERLSFVLVGVFANSGGADWSGGGLGRRHREGTLTFDAAGDPSGEARLTIEGLPELVEATWTLPTG